MSQTTSNATNVETQGLPIGQQAVQARLMAILEEVQAQNTEGYKRFIEDFGLGRISLCDWVLYMSTPDIIWRKPYYPNPHLFDIFDISREDDQERFNYLKERYTAATKLNKKSEGLKTCHDFNRKRGHVGPDGVTSVQEIEAIRDQQEKSLMNSMECKNLLDIASWFPKETMGGSMGVVTVTQLSIEDPRSELCLYPLGDDQWTHQISDARSPVTRGSRTALLDAYKKWLDRSLDHYGDPLNIVFPYQGEQDQWSVTASQGVGCSEAGDDDAHSFDSETSDETTTPEGAGFGQASTWANDSRFYWVYSRKDNGQIDVKEPYPERGNCRYTIVPQTRQGQVTEVEEEKADSA